MATTQTSSGRLAIAAQTRDGRGKGPARQLRRAGRIPATLYGAGGAPVALAVDPKTVSRVLHSVSGHNTIFELRIEGGENTAAMIVDWQLEPLKGGLLHVDLKRIAMDRLLKLRVPVQTQGEAVGVKTQGGILELITREVEIECLPGDIPEFLTVDVSGLSIGQSFRISELKADAKVRILTDADRVISHIIAVKEVVETPAAEAAAATPAEPEVIKKGKAETVEAEGEAKTEGKEAKKEKK